MTNLVMASTVTTETPVEPEFIPDYYIAVQRTQRCSCCKRTAEWSEVFAFRKLRANLGLGKPTRELRRVHELRWNVPLRQTTGKHEVLPFCSQCHAPQVDPNKNLPTPVQPSASAKIIGLWSGQDEAAKPATRTGGTTTVRRPGAAKPPATLDSLLSMLE